MNSGEKINCPLCNDKVDKLLYRFHIDSEQKVLDKIKEQNPGWMQNDGCCSRCVDYYNIEVIRQERILPEVGPHFQVKSADDFIILPTALRVDANPRFTGRGVTICFIDSGFYLHPDLTGLRNRIKTIVDITNPTQSNKYFAQPHNESWHGTMTTVVCAGDGYLSNGLYKGIACDAELVLLKVQDEHEHITAENIFKALQWVEMNYKKYGIRIINMSLGDEEEGKWKDSKIDVLAEELITKGIAIVAASGNTEGAVIMAPANAPNVITVGGWDDDNTFKGSTKLYHSTYGKTLDELMKPELVANAIWIAAPVLPGTKEQEEAAALYKLATCDDEQWNEKLIQLVAKTQMDRQIICELDVSISKQQIINRIQQCKFISAHYMHVDGTSFAAPIVASVIAQLLEAAPGLSPKAIRSVLFSTAKRLPGLPAERQGFGRIYPRKALINVIQNQIIMIPHTSPEINRENKTISFYFHNNAASQISLAGSFNHWAKDVLLLEPGKDGAWKIEIPLLEPGRYAYKFFVDEKLWTEDIENPYREPDGFNGFNSILNVENLS
ncbi:MAG: S8 family serine peptidase [Ferruginibacter sp.]